MRSGRIVTAAAALVLLYTAEAEAYCRRTAPAWTDATPVRVVIAPGAENFIRHPFINSSGLPQDDFACTSSSQCGTDGLCAAGFDPPITNRCRGARWTRSELERAVQWVIGRINNETPADIPFVYLDLTNTHACQIEDDCSDAARPWMNCFQSDTITIMPSQCDRAQLRTAYYNGTSWVDDNDTGRRNQLVFLGWSGSPRGMTFEHTAGHSAKNLPELLLHEIGHGLGLGHLFNELSGYPTCVPNVPPTPPSTHPLCPTNAFGTCPLMHGDSGEGLGLSQHFYGFDDIEGLVNLYGLDSAPETRVFEDCDIGSPSFVEWPTNDLPLITDVASAPNQGVDGYLFLGGRARDSLYQERFQIYQWSYSTTSSTLLYTINTPGFRSSGPLGVTASSTHRGISAHPVRLTNDARHWRRQVRLVRRAAGGVESTATYDPPANVWPNGLKADTAVPGVSTVYHPATDSWLHAIRDPNGQILLVAWRASTWSNVVQTGIQSFATPAIACTPNTCMLAYAEVPTPRPPAATTQTRLQWTEGTISWPSGGSLSFASVSPAPPALVVNTSWYNIVSDPVASAVRNPSGGWYYYVSTSWPQQSGGSWGTRALTYRRSEYSTGTSALIQMTRNVSTRLRHES